MSAKNIKASVHEKRKGESALSDFAEYVEQQQNLRFPVSRHTAGATTAPDASTSKTAHPEHHHEELDELFDNLDLADTAPRISLKDLVLGEGEDNVKRLRDVIADRIDEGMGETVFELGYEYNGQSMGLGLQDWNAAYKRVVEAAKSAGADCELLLTKNVGGKVEAESTISKPEKNGGCNGKILIRRVPTNVEDVIETRIAVVGN
ncbi:hypothetical protein E4U54_006827, partial [Claviceps lovelessii]